MCSFFVPNTARSGFTKCGALFDINVEMWRPGRRAFAVAGPMTFNALSNDLRDPSVSTDATR